MQEPNQSRSAPPPTLTWQPRNPIANTLHENLHETHRGTKVNIEKQVKAAGVQFESPSTRSMSPATSG